MNNVQLIGRVTKDLELHETKKGISVTNIPIAVNEFLGKERGTRTDFPYLTVFGPQAENCVAHLRKGSLIGVNGRIQTQKKESAAGNTIFSTDIIVKSIEFLSRAPEATELGGMETDLGNRVSEDFEEELDKSTGSEIEIE